MRHLSLPYPPPPPPLGRLTALAAGLALLLPALATADVVRAHNNYKPTVVLDNPGPNVLTGCGYRPSRMTGTRGTGKITFTFRPRATTDTSSFGTGKGRYRHGRTSLATEERRLTQD